MLRGFHHSGCYRCSVGDKAPSLELRVVLQGIRRCPRGRGRFPLCLHAYPTGAHLPSTQGLAGGCGDSPAPRVPPPPCPQIQVPLAPAEAAAPSAHQQGRKKGLASQTPPRTQSLRWCHQLCSGLSELCALSCPQRSPCDSPSCFRARSFQFSAIPVTPALAPARACLLLASAPRERVICCFVFFLVTYFCLIWVARKHPGPLPPHCHCPAVPPAPRGGRAAPTESFSGRRGRADASPPRARGCPGPTTALFPFLSPPRSACLTQPAETGGESWTLATVNTRR